MTMNRVVHLDRCDQPVRPPFFVVSEAGPHGVARADSLRGSLGVALRVPGELVASAVPARRVVLSGGRRCQHVTLAGGQRTLPRILRFANC